ncbi:unnamed protein product [Alopecurus aequalis]
MDLWRRLTNKGSVPRQADTSSRSVTASVSGTHDFVVANYSQIRDLPVGHSVCSGTFTVGGYDWYLRFYPCGLFRIPREFPEHAAASVHLRRREETDVVATARVTIGLVDCHGTTPSKGTSDAYVFLPVVKPQEIPNFVRKSKLTSRRYLVGDCLRIRCVLTVIKPRKGVTMAGPAATAPLPDLHGDLKRMLRDGKGTDVTIHVRGQAFHAHRCMLAARSPVFDAEIFGPMKRKDTERVAIDDMEPTVFELLLHFIYTDSLPDNGEGCSTAVTPHLLLAADRYGMDKLKQVCDMRLRASLDVETVGTTLLLAVQHQCPLLREACVMYMSSSQKVLADVMATQGFKHLSTIDPLVNLTEILSKFL